MRVWKVVPVPPEAANALLCGGRRRSKSDGQKDKNEPRRGLSARPKAAPRVRSTPALHYHRDTAGLGRSVSSSTATRDQPSCAGASFVRQVTGAAVALFFFLRS